MRKFRFFIINNDLDKSYLYSAEQLMADSMYSLMYSLIDWRKK